MRKEAVKTLSMRQVCVVRSHAITQYSALYSRDRATACRVLSAAAIPHLQVASTE